jgi:large subunit ribosomal protein L15
MSMTHQITTGALRNKLPKRKGRGESSGHGKTSGRGNKGSKARVGTYIRRGYEGGQTQIFIRLPKRGFSNDNFERRFYIVNLADLEKFPAGAVIDPAALKEASLIPDHKLPVKILGNGEFTKKLTISASKFSHGAYDRITAAGGSAQNLKGEPFAFPKEKKKFIPREPVKKPKKGQEPAADEAPKAESRAAEAKPAAEGETKLEK